VLLWSSYGIQFIAVLLEPVKLHILGFNFRILGGILIAVMILLVLNGFTCSMFCKIWSV